MALDRPPRSPADAVTDRVRSSILREAARLEITPSSLLDLHARAEHLANFGDIIHDVEERYQLEAGELVHRIERRAKEWASAGRFTRGPYDEFSDPLDLQQRVLNEHGSELILLELPDTEFLKALEHAGASVPDPISAGMAEQLFTYADHALRAHGVPYRRAANTFRFEWVGDPAQHALTVGPALLALADRRLTGARAEFDEALAKRRLGAPKNLEDAVDEAAKSVESVLKVLHHEHNVALPAKQQISSLFNTLVAAPLLPGYIDQLVAAPAGPRNHMASHGQGGTVREVPAELADASIAAAATAITFLAHYLP